MTLQLIILFITPLLAGLASFLFSRSTSSQYRLLLVFAGAYLFAITVVHILPELYRQNEQVEVIGLFVLCGFFLQQVLEYFTSGIEHGHVHTHTVAKSNGTMSAIVLLTALCIHAFLEGGMLAQPASSGFHYDANAVLLGIVLHRIPASFALMTVLSQQLQSHTRALPYLLMFSIAAAVGLLLSSYFVQTQILTEAGLVYLYALVSGNFLHISTTIVFESSPGHHFNMRKLAAALAGALVAVIIEYVI
jgi:zinc transporter ZupT